MPPKKKSSLTPSNSNVGSSPQKLGSVGSSSNLETKVSTLEFVDEVSLSLTTPIISSSPKSKTAFSNVPPYKQFIQINLKNMKKLQLKLGDPIKISIDSEEKSYLNLEFLVLPSWISLQLNDNGK